jgi:hypothetical protein
MNDQLKTIFIKAKFNFVILAIILLIAILGKLTNPELSNSIFLATDQLASNLYLVLIAITLGAFVSNFKLVAFGAIGIFVATVGLVHLDMFQYFTIEYLFAALIVTLGFAAIANLYRRYQEYGP